jgi:pimeloyl-ACP methyl ester carboxylesterase/uncharacterized damage-inducible protein DinB
MKQLPLLLLVASLSLAQRAVDLPASDGIVLKATYFAASKPGPAVLLFHQGNRTRKSWDGVAAQLSAAGIHTLALDYRGHGESGGKYNDWPKWPSDLDTALQYLVSQPGVNRDVIGVGGAGGLGVDDAVEMARRHPAQVKSLVLLSGEALPPQMRFLRQSSQLPELFVASDDDEYPPTTEMMKWLYVISSNPGKQFVHYVGRKAPWLWYETADGANGKVPATGGHGTDLFRDHPDLPGIIVDWCVTTLIKTPGRAPADAVASAAILNDMEIPGGVAQVKRELIEAQKKDPEVQLWPEVNVDAIASDHLRDGDKKGAIELYRLNLDAYPNSADAHFNLADAYLQDGQKDLSRQYAEKALSMLDSHAAPLSSWSDTEQRRIEIRRAVQETIAKAGEATAAAPQQTQAPQVVRSRAEETLEWWNQIGKKLIAMAKDFPEDKYDFKVQKDERTFGENLVHVAAVDYDLISRVAGTRVGPDFGKDKHNPPPDLFKTKADVVKLMEGAVADGARVIQQQGDGGLDRTQQFGWETGRHMVHNSYLWLSGIEHSTEHFGQLVVYYRANNLVPPESR